FRIPATAVLRHLGDLNGESDVGGSPYLAKPLGGRRDIIFEHFLDQHPLVAEMVVNVGARHLELLRDQPEACPAITIPDEEIFREKLDFGTHASERLHIQHRNKRCRGTPDSCFKVGKYACGAGSIQAEWVARAD